MRLLALKDEGLNLPPEDQVLLDKSRYLGHRFMHSCGDASPKCGGGRAHSQSMLSVGDRIQPKRMESLILLQETGFLPQFQMLSASLAEM
ncbi:hypothetical protein E5288_WYG006293 [Bos mutus]|uniref:Uncharacterized protein n=1 Tax=Bos mutus TaxID=72004 RepID=A0A6B0QRZ3_9CETA|nr:hypothetical protein [Bos mutus]